MSDTRSQLEEVDALIAAAPDDPSLQQLREDLLQLIALEEQEAGAGDAQPQQQSEAPAVGDQSVGTGESEKPVEQIQHHADPEPATTTSSSAENQSSNNYTAQGTFMEHIVSKEAVAEAPDLGSFQPVVYSSSKAAGALKSDESASNAATGTNDETSNTNSAAAATQQPEKKKKKKKKKSDDAVLDAKFELPTHLVPLESDTPAQKLKKQRTAKALKSKFREKQKEAEHAKRQNDWKSFATKGGKKRKGGMGSGSIFSTEEGVNARVGVISGGGGRKMTGFADPNKRHKFT